MHVPLLVILFGAAASIPRTLATSNPGATSDFQVTNASPSEADMHKHHNREIVNAPPAALPTRPTQASPVMTIYVGGKPALYTQRFSAVPDQWPLPKKGKIWLGKQKGEKGK